MTEQQYLTTAEAATYLGTTVRAVQSHVLRGNLVPDKPGGRGGLKSHRFLRETLDAFGASRAA